MARLICLLVLACVAAAQPAKKRDAVPAPVSEPPAASSPPLHTSDDIIDDEALRSVPIEVGRLKHLPLKLLRRLLDDRRLSCGHCNTKAEYIEFLVENKNAPVSGVRRDEKKRRNSPHHESSPAGGAEGVRSPPAAETPTKHKDKKSESEGKKSKGEGVAGDSVPPVAASHIGGSGDVSDSSSQQKSEAEKKSKKAGKSEKKGDIAAAPTPQHISKQSEGSNAGSTNDTLVPGVEEAQATSDAASTATSSETTSTPSVAPKASNSKSVSGKSSKKRGKGTTPSPSSTDVPVESTLDTASRGVKKETATPQEEGRGGVGVSVNNDGSQVAQ